MKQLQPVTRCSSDKESITIFHAQCYLSDSVTRQCPEQFKGRCFGPFLFQDTRFPKHLMSFKVVVLGRDSGANCSKSVWYIPAQMNQRAFESYLCLIIVAKSLPKGSCTRNLGTMTSVETFSSCACSSLLQPPHVMTNLPFLILISLP